jgi:hypothetical protein
MRLLKLDKIMRLLKNDFLYGYFVYGYIFVLLALVRAGFESHFSDVESKGAFFFFKSWFYSLLFLLDLKLLNKLLNRKYIIFSFLIPFSVFSLFGVFLDREFWTYDFRSGIQIFELPKAFFSFLFFARGVPKTSIFFLFFLKLVGLVLLRKDLFRFILYFLLSYSLWVLFHLSFVLGKSNPVFLIFTERTSYFILGGVFLLLFFLIASRDFLKDFLWVNLKNYSLIYIFILAFVGAFSVGKRDYINIILSFFGVFSFFITQQIINLIGDVIVRQDEKSEGHQAQKIIYRIFFLFYIAISLFGGSRGMFLVPLPIIVLFSAFYHLPPFELKRKFLGPIFYSIFAGFLVFVSHLSASKTFSIPSEVFSLALCSLVFALFDSSAEKVHGTLKKLFSAITCVVPSLFFFSVENVVFSVFLAILSWWLKGSRIFRVISIFYFASFYSYQKYVKSADIF